MPIDRFFAPLRMTKEIERSSLICIVCWYGAEDSSSLRMTNRVESMYKEV